MVRDHFQLPVSLYADSFTSGPRQQCATRTHAPDDPNLHWHVEELPNSCAVRYRHSLFTSPGSTSKDSRFRSFKYTNCVLDLVDGNRANGTPIQICPEEDNNPSQRWYLRKKGFIAK